jgi:hypothetical protein
MSSADLSVVLVNKYGLSRLRRVLTSLAEQSIADHLELVIVSPFDAPHGEPFPFAGVRFVKCGTIYSLGTQRAAGVQVCTAPFLVFGEDHSFPRPGWAEALLRRLREGWTGVGPVLLNHNPSTRVSRADFLLNYGFWSRGCPGGPVRAIPPHNSAYRAAELQALGPELAELLEMDHHLQARLLSQGGRMFIETEAETAHTNVSRPLIQWISQFNGARIYGATRAATHRWPAYRSGIYAASFPAIGALRFARACALLRDWRELSLLPFLAIAAGSAAAGEAYGYLFGSGSSLRYRVEEELDRASCVVLADRPLLFT